MGRLKLSEHADRKPQPGKDFERDDPDSFLCEKSLGPRLPDLPHHPRNHSGLIRRKRRSFRDMVRSGPIGVAIRKSLPGQKRLRPLPISSLRGFFYFGFLSVFPYAIAQGIYLLSSIGLALSGLI